MKFTSLLKTIIVEQSRFEVLFNALTKSSEDKSGAKVKPKLTKKEFITLVKADPTTRLNNINIDTASSDELAKVKAGAYVQWLIKNYLNPKTERQLGDNGYEKEVMQVKDTFMEDLYKVTDDLKKFERFKGRLPKEKRDINKDKWIYNIIDGISEQESILYKDDKCIVIPSYMWNSTDVDKLQILCLPIDKSLRTIRSLEMKHIPLLKHMKQVTCAVIKHKHGLDECYIKHFFHYEPSTYHLHIHFMNIANFEAPSSVEYSHELDSVIFNLMVLSNYYKQIIMNKRI
jgi:hypothetical protein